jgi:quercetin dioxygenase-like cupin family protein
MTALDQLILDDARFVEIPGMRGLKLARLGQANGKTLEVIDAAKGVTIPAMTHPSAEHGRVLKGRVRFMQAGQVRELTVGDTWDVAANVSQGPHVILEDDTRVALLRDGKSAFDVV